MKRDIQQYLKAWKNSENRKPIIIRGARQVGKTYIIKKFAAEEFELFMYINLELESGLQTVFKSKNPELIINELTAIYNIPLIGGKTLLFIDEIQTSPEAIAALRYFYEQVPSLHVVAAGSLLDHTLNEMQYSMPIGRVEYAYLYPLNFQEFLIAMDKEGLISYINNYSINSNFSKAIHNKILEYLRLYFFIGGMPEAIKTYIKTKNLIEVEKIHANILTSLQYDFAKYGSRRQQDFLKAALQYVANNIGKKVKYTNIDRDAHSSQIKDVLLKLETSRVIYLVRQTRSINPPITQFASNDKFKPLFIDIGLVCHLAQIKLNNLQNLITDFEGALAEQFVGQELISSFPFYKETKLYYWLREAKSSNAEIDYLFQKENEIYPMEVKGGKTGTLKSMQVYLGEKTKSKGIRLNLDLPNFGKDLKAKIMVNKKEKSINYSLISLPMYFAGILNKIDFKN